MPNGRQRGGFNPDRMADLTRPVSVVPQIVEAPQESPAREASSMGPSKADRQEAPTWRTE